MDFISHRLVILLLIISLLSFFYTHTNPIRKVSFFKEPATYDPKTSQSSNSQPFVEFDWKLTLAVENRYFFALQQSELIQASFATLKQYNLLQNMGQCSELQMAALHRYTVNSDFILYPMRGVPDFPEKLLDLPQITLNEFNSAVYYTLTDALNKLRKTSRLYKGDLYRGRTFAKADFEMLFSNRKVPLKGFQSCSKDITLAKNFAPLSKQFIPGQKVCLIMKIKSKRGVDIDDISEWGENLGPICHADKPFINKQQEVLLEEGFFKLLSSPKKYYEGGKHKIDDDGTEWFITELEEMGESLRKISFSTTVVARSSHAKLKMSTTKSKLYAF